MQITYCDLQGSVSKLELSGAGGIIGYEKGNFITLDEVGISALHMRLTSSENRLFAEDLQSLNGTYLNKKLLTEKVEVRNGDTLLVGMVLLQFQKANNLWFLSASRQDSSLFVVDEYKPVIDGDENDPTAVTVIAPREMQDSIENGDVKPLDSKSSSHPKSLLPGEYPFDSLQELGVYRLVKKIGKGGMGVVFLAKHKVMNTYRAVKVLPHCVKEDNADIFERFMREARIASEFRHPNIVGVMDVEKDLKQQVSYIVMEFIDGGTLRRILKNQKTLPEIQALLIVRSVAEALKAIAAHKIVHRDIKPDNIMFTRYGEVKLADLGIAKNEEEDVTLTRTNIMIGTPAYLSPEQMEHPKDVDIRSDIYSLGATLYEMLTGTPPYTGKNAYDLMRRRAFEAIVDPRKKNPEVSAVAAKIVMKMLQKNPAKRYQTPHALLVVLDRVLSRYSNSVARNIIRSAVLGTELPYGVKKTVTSGVWQALDFMLFCFRQSLPGSRSATEKGSGGTESGSGNESRHFSFQIDPELASEKAVDLTVSAPGGTFCRLVSSDGSSVELRVPENGKLELKELLPGEYRILPGEGKKP